MEYLVADRRKSICYRDGEVFRKYFRYADRKAAEHEGKYSRLYEAIGISTPHFIKTDFSPERGQFFNEYSYVNMRPIDEADLDDDISQKILRILDKAASSQIFYSDGVEFWEQSYRAELTHALGVLKSYVDVDTDQLLRSVYVQKISVLMHGDFSLSNMSLAGDVLYLYDFASSGYAPRFWDLGYLVATLRPDVGQKFCDTVGNEDLLACIKLASAVRLGRSLRKHEDIERRSDIFKYWSEASL